ncbi:MAG: acyl carrier protein [Desulfovibrio desulfuricans]|nr:acyl carrier protein [Desulfovibrio desulfuricans]
MTLAQFLIDFQDILQRDEPLTPETLLTGVEEWDSLAVMGCLAYFDRKFGVKTTFAQYQQIRTVADVVAMVSGHVK